MARSFLIKKLTFFFYIFFKYFLPSLDFNLESFNENESLETKYCLPLFQCNYLILMRVHCNISLIYFRACSLFLELLYQN
jgi:hypothetical protein